ncbi:RNA polymerase II C-terminal domain kinase beta subunit [Metarhizium acridum]|nr:RNA polymerase II C-terminal domain kinase beta subunit [Metarhizium acridum]
MIEAADLVKPHLIICPFLTSLVPQQVYETYLTLIVHPGPPGDAGPSALDWMLMGDDGTVADSQQLLRDNRFNPRRVFGIYPLGAPLSPPTTPKPDGTSSSVAGDTSPGLSADKEFAQLSVTTSEPFLGGKTHHRPLLKASDRHFDIRKHTASTISRRIRSADSQPGCLSDLFGPKLYLYGGIIENPTLLSSTQRSHCTGQHHCRPGRGSLRCHL